MDVNQKVIAITGAGRGLGRALGLGLAAAGARIALLERDGGALEATAREIERSVPGAEKPLALACDVTDEVAVASAVRAIDDRWGRIDALVSNAGLMLPTEKLRLLNADISDVRRVLDTNLVAGFIVTKAFAPVMIRGGGGRIIYMSSMIGVQAGLGLAPYGASKAGLNLLANVAHRELADQGIRTVALAPGLTDTPGMRGTVEGGYAERVASAYPGGRLGQPEDIVPFVRFLCSDVSVHLSGTVLPIRPVTG
ncbi:3-oxoacyl-[acyl-carrier protein] reductase [Actinacidiphila alni]|uniref:3-oxoacyl-[acyl-carrier protein] reductase n=1 Tax=Actinacidiphila alni TaxID=380248 RepID=A0A1I2L7X4_9ACTN|nr:SDR family oxidoreductase [Actinacidiphila alni]SFF75424.1 3-oxoacyl-[acyl-carrier protein] reductase [Actinacidiphila alni]